MNKHKKRCKKKDEGRIKKKDEQLLSCFSGLCSAATAAFLSRIVVPTPPPATKMAMTAGEAETAKAMQSTVIQLGESWYDGVHEIAASILAGFVCWTSDMHSMLRSYATGFQSGTIMFNNT